MNCEPLPNITEFGRVYILSSFTVAFTPAFLISCDCTANTPPNMVILFVDTTFIDFEKSISLDKSIYKPALSKEDINSSLAESFKLNPAPSAANQVPEE